MIPPDIAATLREALTIAINEFETEFIYGNPEKVQMAKKALQYLDTLPAAPAPDWSAAPSWAMWSILDLELGIRSVRFRRLYLEFEPELQHDMWRFGGRFESGELVHLPLGIDWRETLVARPTEDK